VVRCRGVAATVLAMLLTTGRTAATAMPWSWRHSGWVWEKLAAAQGKKGRQPGAQGREQQSVATHMQCGS
jgi:hypothetical protein